MPKLTSRSVLFAIVMVAMPLDGWAQVRDSTDDASPTALLPLLGSAAEDLDRLSHVVLGGADDGFLHRTPSSRLPRLPGEGFRWSALDPMLETIFNSDLPFSLNHGPLWAGRGWNVLVTGGFRASLGALDLVLAPQFTHSQNLDFQTISPRDTARSQFASPWHAGPQSADLPLRFGDRPLAILHPGQSSVALRSGPLRGGVTTENEWWGPGIRNAILLSSNAEGFPRAFLETQQPIGTRLGDFGGRWILGALTESLHFDDDPENDTRALNGLIATYSPPRSDLTLGVSRVVYSSVPGAASVATHGLDVLTWWKNQVLPPDSTIRDSTALARLRAATGPGNDREQMTALFGRWVFPADNLEVYAEWARTALPSSLPDLLTEPQHSQGYTIGLQWARPFAGDALFRMQTEVTYLEESSTFDNRPVPSFYVSPEVPQGYTHRGRTLGAAIGPGASSQWLAGDYISPGWRLGLYFGRIRWENDVYYRGVDRREVGHDVSLWGGIRTGGRVLGSDVLAEFGGGNRFNYLFQNPGLEPEGTNAIDQTNLTFRLVITPGLGSDRRPVR